MSDAAFSSRDGLATLGPAAVALRGALDDVFVAWALDRGAQCALYPPLLRVDDLARFDYFANFPHLGLCATGIADPGEPGLPVHPVATDATVPAQRLAPAAYVLPSAACYSVYLAMRGSKLSGPLTTTTVAQCFRREAEYDGLRRLHGFTMREVVSVGREEHAKDHLAGFRDLVLGFAGRLGMPLRVQVATDPFFDPRGSRALAQVLVPVKEEFVTDDGVAVASLNYHRNFFGERAAIEIDGEPAHTACAAFGVERWLDALGTRFGADLESAREAVLRAGARTDAAAGAAGAAGGGR